MLSYTIQAIQTIGIHPGFIWYLSGIHHGAILEPSRNHPRSKSIYSCHESSSTFVATDWLQLYVCTTTCCWHCWLGWTLFFLCFFSGCLSTPFIFICGITTQIAEEHTTCQLACFSLLPAAIEHFVCTLGIEITKPIALKSLMFFLKDISKVTQLRLLKLKTQQRIFTTYQHFARLRLMTSYWCPTSTMVSDVMLLLMLPVFLVVSMKGQTEEGYGYSHNEMDCWTDMLVRPGRMVGT